MSCLKSLCRQIVTRPPTAAGFHTDYQEGIFAKQMVPSIHPHAECQSAGNKRSTFFFFPPLLFHCCSPGTHCGGGGGGGRSPSSPSPRAPWTCYWSAITAANERHARRSLTTSECGKGDAVTKSRKCMKLQIEYNFCVDDKLPVILVKSDFLKA